LKDKKYEKEHIKTKNENRLKPMDVRRTKALLAVAAVSASDSRKKAY
jgi:hypothetical protein